MSLQLAPADIKQRPHQPTATEPAPGRHGSQPAHTGTAQQAEQQRFGLIVAVLRGQQHFAFLEAQFDGVVARLPRRLLQAAPRLDLHVHYLELNPKRRTDAPTVLRPGIRRGLQAVMNMNRPQRGERFAPGKIGQELQQHRGVEPAGERHAPTRRMTDATQRRRQTGFKRHIDHGAKSESAMPQMKTDRAH
ncbi:hypothetical protein SSTU70S_02933 [Stutzerimonas stutzeri]